MSLKLKIRSMFPALVSALSPLVLVKTGLAYVFSFDVSALLASLDPLYVRISNNLSDLAFKYTAKDNISIHGADIASAATVNLETATGDLVDVTGTTTITAITLNEGHERTVRFTGALTITNGASLILSGAANIITSAGDYAVFRGYATGVVRCVGYQKASGVAVAVGSHGADIASAATVDLESAAGDLVDITGTTSITAITLSDGHARTVRFTGILTLTNGASLVLPSGASITTAAGDFAVFRGYAAGVVRCIGYQKASGAAIVAGSGVSSIAGNTGAFTLGVGLTNNVNDIQVKLPYFSASLSAGQTISNNTATKINVNTELADSNSWYDNVTNFRFNPQLAGKYRINGAFAITATTITEVDIYIYKNGSLYSRQFSASSAVTALSLDLSNMVAFNGSTDYVELWCLAVGTGTISVLGSASPLSTWFEAQYVGP